MQTVSSVDNLHELLNLSSGKKYFNVPSAENFTQCAMH